MSFTTADANTTYGNPAYYEASDMPGKDVLGKEQVITILHQLATTINKFLFHPYRLWIIPFMESTANQLMTTFK